MGNPFKDEPIDAFQTTLTIDLVQPNALEMAALSQYAWRCESLGLLELAKDIEGRIEKAIIRGSCNFHPGQRVQTIYNEDGPGTVISIDQLDGTIYVQMDSENEPHEYCYWHLFPIKE